MLEWAGYVQGRYFTTSSVIRAGPAAQDSRFHGKDEKCQQNLVSLGLDGLKTL